MSASTVFEVGSRISISRLCVRILTARASAGTGYSSLSYLKNLPIDTLKIDQSFVSTLTTDPGGAAITAAIIAMAHVLGVKVIAEGVETELQLAFLKERHCNEFQGYLFAKPMPASDFEKILTRPFMRKRVLTKMYPAQ